MPLSGQLFEQLQVDGKRLAADGRLKESLSKFQEARKIMETPKILNRIQKLKDAIANSIQLNSSSKKSKRSANETFRTLDAPKEKLRKSYEDPKCEEQTSRVLSQIDNIEDAIAHSTQFNSSSKKSKRSANETFQALDAPKETPRKLYEDPKCDEQTSRVLSQNNIEGTQNTYKDKIASKPEELSSENLKKFTELKKSAMELSYDGEFKKALQVFTEALKLCNCPKIKKYIQEMEVMISKHEEKLHRFQHLSDTGKKLASEGRQTESLKKLKDAFAVCPSPKVSKIIKMLEVNAEIPAKSVPSDLSNEDFKLPSVLPRKLQSGSSNSDDSDFQSEKFKSEKSKTADSSSLSPDRLQQYKNLYSKARESAASGNLKVALDALNKAKSICPTDKVLKRIKDLQEHIKSTSEEPEDDQMKAVADGFYVFHEIYEKLYPYQRLGVAWMWELFKKQKGGVLGDDMGLGKTFQVIAFLSGLIDAERAKHILIVMPVSLITNWENEFQKWCPGISVCVFHGGSKKERERNILRVQRKGHVLLTSYGMVLNSFENLSRYEGRQFIWDYVILDEGHKIKNPTKTTKAVHNIPSRNRLVLTGTPIQNNLRELWALYDFAHQGTLVGSMKTFKMQYENPITRAREKDATVGEKRLGTEMAENLRMLIESYFLRRTKAEIWGKPGENSDIDNLEKSMDQLRVSKNKVTTRKNDLIVWAFLSKAQCEIYQSFLHSEAVKMTLVSKRSPLVELTTLKKICDHPRLLSQRACLQLGLNGELNEEDLDDETSNASSIENVSDDTLINESGKMKFLISLLENLKSDGHRTLVFSLSRKILDMVHRILVNRNWKVMRLDGTVTKMEERERRIQMFQTDSSYSVFLLTTQVGGVGITLTAADRVVIYDPSWNPATDAQAVDRVYRIGQQKNVVVYRLITCGTVEEKIYRRQIFKDSITKQVTGTSADPNRYFSKQELRELFTLDDPYHSATQVQLNQLHSDQRNTDVSLDEHIAFLHFLNIFGISDHDLMFSKDIVDDTEDNDEGAVSHEYIKKQVAVARELIRVEASVVEEGMRLAGSYTRPYLENIPTYKNNTEKDLYKPPSIIQTNYPSTSSFPTESDPVVRDRKHSYIDYKGAGDQSRVSEVIDLCDSPQKSSLTSKYEESKNSPRSSRRFTKTYEPLLLEKNKINNYFPVISKEDEASTPESSERSSPISDSVSPQHFSTPNKQNISIYETPDTSYNEKKRKVSHNSVFESAIAMSPKVISTKNEEQSAVENEMKKEDSLVGRSPVDSIDLKEEESPKTIQLTVEEDVYIVEDDISTVEEDLFNLSLTSRLKGSMTKYQSISERNVESDYNMSAINKDPSVAENELADHNSSVTNDQSMLDEDLSVYNKTTSKEDDYVTEHITTASKEDQSMLDEEMSDHNKTTSKEDDYVTDQNTTASKEDESMLDHNMTSSKENQSMLDEEVSDLNITSSKEDLSMVDEDLLEHTPKADQSMFIEYVSDHNTTETSTSGESVESKDQISFKDNVEMVGDIDRRLSQSYNDDSSPKKLSDIHLQSDNSPSEPNSNMSPIPKINSSEQGTSSNDLKSNIKNLDISFDLDSSLYDQTSLSEQPAVIRNSRKSCAIQKTFIGYESDSSQPTSIPSTANSSDDEIIESDSDFSNASDSGSPIKEVNSSLSFVASSIPNSPYIAKDKSLMQNLTTSPGRRITPLRLRKSFVSPPNNAFALAMATSPIFTALTNSPIVSSPPRKMSRFSGSFSEGDSPVSVRKTKKIIIVSDSEDSEEE